jgi:hypothetical protein
VKLRGWPKIGHDGGVLLMSYVPCGITGIDDDDDDEMNMGRKHHAPVALLLSRAPYGRPI